MSFSKISLRTLERTDNTVSIDESVTGILFDYCKYGNVFNGYPLAEACFGNGEVQCINNLKEASSFGITANGIMNGVPYYHLQEFYEYIGDDAPIYVSFANCSENFDAIVKMQIATNGKLFQIGVWTEQDIWSYDEENGYCLTNLIGKVGVQSKKINENGSLNDVNHCPFSLIVCANTNHIEGVGSVDYNAIPEIKSLEFPKVSVILGQNGSTTLHAMQNGNNDKCPIGMLGIVLALVYKAPAEESIAYVGKYNLNEYERFQNPELGFGANYSPIDKINTYRKYLLCQKGYIIPVSYKATESDVFLSDDQTLSNKDFSTLSMNRIVHKCRRVIRSAMLPYINDSVYIDYTTGQLSSTSTSIIVNEIINLIDAYMVNGNGSPQIDGRNVSVDVEQNVLYGDKLKIDTIIVPIESAESITFEETYNLFENS